MGVLLERLRIALRVLWHGEEALYAVVRQRLKQDRDIQYLKMMEENRRALAAQAAAIKERDFAVNAMHAVANDALLTIKELEAALVKQSKEQTLNGLLSLHRGNKDDLPN